MIWLRDTFNLNIQKLRKKTYFWVIFAITVHIIASILIECCVISHFDINQLYISNILSSFWCWWLESPLEALFQLCSETEDTNEVVHAMTHCKYLL